MDQEQAAYLDLADWRRRVATLYAEVRAHAASDPEAALAHWRVTREHLYRTHPQSPVPVSLRGTFRALHFPADPALRFEVPVVPNIREYDSSPGHGADVEPPLSTGAGTVSVPTSEGRSMPFRRLGWVDVPFPMGLRRLSVFWMEGYAGGLYLPFGDATNGSETYGAGRYLLDGAKSADLGGDRDQGTLLLDFNFAYHPSCAFDPRWACPLTPPENRLDLPIRAGERLGEIAYM
jgi:uncharacterized protein (DUF1684 family)